MWNLRMIGAVILGVASDRLLRWGDQSWSSVGFVPAPLDINEALRGTTLALLIGLGILYLYGNSLWLRRWAGVLVASALLAFSLGRMVLLWVSNGESAISEPGIALSTVLFLVILVASLAMRKSKLAVLILPLCLTGYVLGRMVEHVALGETMGVAPIVGVLACLLSFWMYWPAIAKRKHSPP